MQIDVYIGDVSELADNAKKQQWYLEFLSDYRKGKVLGQKSPNGRLLSLGAGFLLVLALKKYGITEKNSKYGFSDNGKPYLLNSPKISFNLSHSHNRVMCVASNAGLNLGCDVELVRTGKEKIAERFFTENEKNILLLEDEEYRRAEMFCKIWTLKESFLKCTGEGIGRPMNSFEFKRLDYEDDDYSVEGTYRLKVFDGNHPIFNGYKYALCYKCLENAKDEVEKFVHPVFL